MKVLNHSISLLLLCSFSSLAQENQQQTLDSYISSEKKEMFDFDYQKNVQNALMEEDSWINPINLNYSYSKSDPYEEVQVNENASIKIDQPIFRGGGIFYSIKHARALKKYADYSVDIAKRKMAKDAVALLMQIRQTSLKIQKQNLQIENAKINLELKKEQYLSGQLDSGFLDNAIIERNLAIQALYDIETSKENLISNFETLSDLDYSKATIPHFDLVEEESFLQNNMSTKSLEAAALRDKENRGIIRAKYLPILSLTGGYNWSKSDAKFNNFGSQEKNYYDYGFKVNIPLHINTFRDIEAASIEYLKSEIALQDKQKEMQALFDKVKQNLKNYEKKQALSVENVDIYSKLLADAKELYRAGYKTQYDLDLLENSLEMSEIDSKIYEIDKQLELLNLYELYTE